jgi:type VI secretion system protein ImpJ
MKYLSRVVWSEGMYLGPHHFQAQSRYFEDSIGFTTSALWFEPWGLVGAQLDGEALKNGTVSLIHARGILPDGMVFHMPESDPLPEPRNIADLFPAVRDTVTIMLAVAPRRPEGANTLTPGDTASLSQAASQENGALRFRAEIQMLHDETTGRDEKPVHIGRKNIKLLLDTENPGDMVTLPIARIMRDGSGHFIFDESFIPPSVGISASDRLMSILGRLIEILEEKSSRFSRSAGGGKEKSWAEFSTREIANFWLLHTVNSSLAPLRHQYHTKRGHPEELFVDMLKLGGALCTFAIESHPRDLPLYDHRNLDKCFGALDEHIRIHLETIVPTQFIEIPLVKRAEFFYEAAVTDQRVLDKARWIFAVRSHISEPDLIAKTPQLVKLCSKDFVPQLVKRALPGMSLTHLPVPPSAIPVKADTQYFSVSRSGPCWDHIVQTRQLGLYVPGDLPDPTVELLVILEA